MSLRPNVSWGNGPIVSDEVYLMEMWKPAITVPKPYRESGTVYMWEGGYVASVDYPGFTVHLDATRTRQAINPLDGSPAYATSLTKDHSGRTVLVWSGSQVGRKATIVSNDAYSLTLSYDKEQVTFVPGDLLVICDEVFPSSINANWDIDQLSAACEFSFDTAAGDPIRRLSPYSCLYWRKRGATQDRLLDTGWVPYGIWVAQQPQDDLRDAQMPLRFTTVDMLRYAQTTPVEARFQADIVRQYGDGTYSLKNDAKVLKLVQQGSGDDSFMRFYDSPESNIQAIMTNHTFNWCGQFYPILFASVDQNPYINTGGATPDVVVSIDGTNVQILYGNGEIRITTQWYKANMSPDAGTGAIAFNGGNQFVQGPYWPGTHTPPTEIGVSGWFQLTGLPMAGTRMQLCGFMQESPGQPYLYLMVDDEGHLWVRWSSDGGGSVTKWDTGLVMANDGAWHHIAFGLVDNGANLRCWLDNVAATPHAVTPVGALSFEYLNIGTTDWRVSDYDGFQWSFLSGSVDEFVGTYGTSGDTLTDAKVAAEWNSGNGTTTHTDLLNAKVWHFNGTVDYGVSNNGPFNFGTGKIVSGAGSGRPYLKAQYATWCDESHVHLGAATSFSGTTVLCSWISESGSPDTNLYWPIGSDAISLANPNHLNLNGQTLRFTTGDARGATYTLVSNTHNSATLDRDPRLEGAAVGDYFEIGAINDAVSIMETSLLKSGYQVYDADRPLYLAPLDPAIQPDTCASVQWGIPGNPSSADLTAAASDESINSLVWLYNSDPDLGLYVGHTYPYCWLAWSLWEPDSIPGVIHEYPTLVDGGIVWKVVPKQRYTDTTQAVPYNYDPDTDPDPSLHARFVQDGYMRWNRPNDWAMLSINGAGPYFYTRFRGTEDIPTHALTFKRIQVMGRSQYKSPTQYRERDGKTAQAIFSDLRQARSMAPNWILRADFDGTIVASSVVQGEPVWDASGPDGSAIGMRHTQHSTDLVTATTYLGYSENWDNILMSGRWLPGASGPVTITANDLSSQGIVPAPINDQVNGCNVLLR